MTPQEWLTEFANKLGVEAPDQAAFDALLEIAAEAAHSSERTAAPVACYLVGQTGTPLADAMRVAAEIGESG